VAIPMAGYTESLNVAASVAICLYEQLRQKRSAPR
jgi:tRNA G18 (ribose-2'-O)-methylase SpoU